MTSKLPVDPGLEGVVVGTTAISEVDGAAGRLSYRGYPLETLTERPFAAVATLVMLGEPATDLSGITDYIDSAGNLRAAETARVLALPPELHPMHMLQSLIPTLDNHPAAPVSEAQLKAIAPSQPTPADLAATFADGLALAVKLPQLIATHRARRALTPAGNSYAERFLNACGATVEPKHSRAFEVMQILQLEHSFNASTFAARVIASTRAPIANALAGAIGTLHGPLHGGADEAALKTADEVGTPARAAAFVDTCIKKRRKVMGMGHREYRVLDPRAVYGKALAEQLTRGTEHEVTFATLVAIEDRFRERMAEQHKTLHANIEFYKGLIFRTLGFEPQYFTALFAMARSFGYLAHVLESRFDNRLIRPAALYRPADSRR